MSAATNYLENAIQNHVLRNTAMASPTTVYLSLHTGSPGEAGTANEIALDGYQRKAVTFGAPSNGVCSNSAPVEFGPAGENWGTISHFAIWDAATSGNSLIYGALTTSRVVNNGDTLTFATGALVVTLD